MLTTKKQLQIADEEITNRIDNYSGKFWASADRNPRDDLHALMQYPAMMVPEIQRELIRVICDSQDGIINVLDPFVGAATTMTSCMSFGLNFTGQDINPLAVLISRTKTGPFNVSFLQESLNRVFSLIIADRSNKTETDFPKIDKWFQSHTKLELDKIRRAIRKEDQLWVRRFLWVALAESVRLTSNTRTSTYKLHIRSSDDIKSRNISAIKVFQSVALQNLDDLRNFKDSLQEHLNGGNYKGQLSVYLQDSSEKIYAPNNDALYDLLITSPPYGDNLSTVTYGQFSYLPLQWIDLEDIDTNATNNDILRTTQEIDRKSLGGFAPELDAAVSYLAEHSLTYKRIIEKLRALPKDRPKRVTSFLYDLEKTLKPIVALMRMNSYLIWVIGNRHVGGLEIPTNMILEELLEYLDVRLIKSFDRDILYRRMATRNQIAGMMRKEHILVFRKQRE